MTGLLHVALNITSQMLQQNLVPSGMTQVSICQALRKVGRIRQMESFLLEIGKVVTAENIASHCVDIDTDTDTDTDATQTGTVETSLFAYNIFLATLCDPIVDRVTDRTCWAPVDPPALLDRAYSWLDTNQTRDRLNLLPNEVSYATVLNAASEIGNYTLAELIWQQVLDRVQANNTRTAIPLTSRLFNARLKCLQQEKDDQKAMDLWQQITLTAHANKKTHTNYAIIKPDKYTIDFMLVPLLRAGSIGEIETMLDDFVSDNSETIVSQAFEAFLWSIVVKGGDVAAARAIFDMYIKPALAPVVTNRHGNKIRLVRPRTQHFTILLEGYKAKIAQNQQIGSPSLLSSFVAAKSAVTGLSQSSSITPNETARKGFESPSSIEPTQLYDEAWELFNLLLQSSKTSPDEFTITVMIGLCRSSNELTNLLGQAIHDLGLNCTGAFLRAAVGKYGELGDPSSAIVLFAKFLQHPVPTRYWNVLLGAIVKSSDQSSKDMTIPISNATSCSGAQSRLNFGNTDVNRILQNGSNGSVSLLENGLLRDLSGQTCWEAAKTLVNHYIQSPNSQTFCLLAKAATKNKEATNDAGLALEIFHNASSLGIPADGRFANAVFRCFGTDIDAAINAWKSEIRHACLAYENRPRSKPVPPSRIKGKNLLAAYHGLIFVSGRALRPDIALRLVYAMSREGLDPDETALNCYKAGKHSSTISQGENEENSKEGPGYRRKLQRLLNIKMVDAYESLLYVECVKYNKDDKRRAGERRIRIIL